MNLKTIQQQKNTIQIQKHEIDELNKIFHQEQKKIRVLKEDREYIKFKEFSQEKEKLESKTTEIVAKINSVFSSLDKSIRKFQKLLDSDSATGDSKKILKSYIDQPLETLNKHDPEQKNLNSILNKIQNNISEGKLDLKDEKKEKTLNLIKNILDKNYLTDLSSQYRFLEKRKEDINYQIQNLEIRNKIESQEIKVSELKDEINKKEQAIRDLDEDKKQLEKDILKKKESVAIDLEKILDQRIEILID
jgi:hypothetical protein